MDILDEEATPSDLLLICCQFCKLHGGPAVVAKERIFSLSARLHMNLKLLSKLKHNFSVELPRTYSCTHGSCQEKSALMRMSMIPSLPEEESAPPTEL